MSTGTLANYSTVVSCSAGTLSATNGQATSTVTLSAAAVAAGPLTCTYTNALKTASLQLKKTWTVNSIAGDTITVATTGGTANPSVSSTATAAGNTTSGTPATVTVDNIISLPAENFDSGQQANYTTRVSCNNAAVPLTNATLPASFKVAATDTALVCTYTNTPKTVTLQLKKTWAVNSMAGNVIMATTTGGSANASVSSTATLGVCAADRFQLCPTSPISVFLQ